jgi:CheY-like chemotaxis protein
VPRPRILVVDDSATVLHVVEQSLSGEYEVETASDGTDGLMKARRCPPDLIVTDSLMPGLDGFALLTALNADPRTRSIPAIVLTSAGEAPRGDLKIAAVVAKSMDLSPLLSAIKSALALRVSQA